MNNLGKRIEETFREKFAGEPSLYFSPGRINLIGEHIDYNDGYVMPGAIDKGIYFAVALNHTQTMNFYAFDFDEKMSIDIKDVKKKGGWKNYVLSVVNEFILVEKEMQGFDCVFGGNIAKGAGMSSSAAVEGGIAFAINELMGFGLDRKDLALLCQRAEHGFPGVNCGIMDQYANMSGKKDHVMLLDCKSVTHEYLPLDLKDSTIVLVNSKVHHSLASSEYNNRRKECEKGLQIIRTKTGIQSFRDVKKAEDLLPFKEEMGDVIYKRCLYVVEEILRTKQAAQFLKQDDIVAFGKLMFQAHEGLRDLYEVSCKELDFLVDFASGNEDVIGARLMGGGFGGCTINIVKEEGKDDFISKIIAAYKARFNIDAEIYEVNVVDGTHEI
jgi:galactokinase